MAGNEEYDEEMEAERELADSAMWKVIQKNTFTRWTNEHLKQSKLQIVNMEKDFSDGLKLIALIEALSGKKFAKYNKKPSFRTQKFENVTMSLKFLEEKEGIKLVNIDSSDIVDAKLKLIMGLIWTLILHYSITMPTWEDEGGFGKDQTPKQRLLAWIQNKIPEKNINNFTSDWNDGTAIAALVDALAPGLIPDCANMLPANKIQNAKEAMDLAEKFLDVPQVIKPDEMCNPKVDELSMMTYLSRFPSAKLKSGAPVQQKPNAQRIRAYGPGIEPQGNVVGAPARFIVETANAGKGDLEVIVLDPKGKPEKVELLPNNDRTQSYNCVYTPSTDGPYTVSIKYAGQPSTKQPYLVNVAPKDKTGDPAKVTAQGPGVEKSGVLVNRKTYFDVITKGAGIGVVDVGVFDPQGKPLKATVTKKSDDVWYVEYTAEIPGLHSVNVNFAGKPIPKSPYPVGVGGEGGPPVDASRLPGKPIACSPRDAAANSLATPLKAVPGSTAPVAEQPQQQLKPMPPGKFPVAAEVPEDQGPSQAPGAAAKPAPPPVQIPVDAKKCWATGRGIQPKGVRLGDLADFKIHTENAGNAEPKAMVMGPGGTPVQTTLKKLDDVTYEAVYKPTKPGLHIVNVTFAGQQIPKSPFKVDVGPLKTSKVVAFGPGLESGVVNQPAKFTVQPNGEGPIGFKIEGPSQAKIDVTKNPQQTEMYVTYLPTVPGEYAVRILSNNDDIPKSPYIVDIKPVGEVPLVSKPAAGQAAPLPVDSSKVTAFGPGLELEGNVVNKWAEFTVDATKAGQAPLVVTVTDAENKNVELKVVDNKNLTFSCKYLPLKAIRHTVTIIYNTQQIPKSPYLVNVKDSGVGAGKVKVYGPAIEKPVQTKILTYFIIDCKEAGPGEPEVTLTNEKGQPVNFQKKDLKDRTYRVEFTAMTSGVYTSHVTFSKQPVPKSPFPINVLGGPDASKVTVYGPALEGPVKVNEMSYFIVDCKEAGPGEPRVVLMSEKGGSIPTKIVDQNDRTYKVEFTAPMAGLYNANVQFASSPVPKSPFKITAQATVDIRQVFVKDLPEFVPVNKEVPFEVVTAGAGPGKVKVVITSPTGKSVPVRLDEKPGVVTTCKFIPTEPGPYKVEVFFADVPVAKSPFKVTAEAANPFNVKVYGPAVEQPVFVNEVTYFIVDFKEAGPGEPQVKLVDEKGVPIPFNVLDQKDKTHRIEFTPLTPGTATATVTFAGQSVPKSPYRITIQIRTDSGKVKVYGPALEKPVPIRQTTYFVIDCKQAGPGIPDFNLATEDGKPVQPKFIDNKDQTFTVEFVPESFSPIIAYVNFLGQPAPKSPYKIIIFLDLSKVKVYGPAVEGPVAPKVPTYFTIDCKEVGPGVPKVALTDDNGVNVPFTLNDNKDGTFKVDFIPESVPLTANVLFADQPVPKSPFKINVLGGLTDPSKVKLSGPAFEGPVAPKEPTYFKIDCKEAGPGEPKVTLTDENKTPVPFTLKDNKDGTYTTELTPVSTTPITTEVTFAGKPVPQSPFKIVFSLSSKVKVYGPAVEKPVAPKVTTYFTVDCKEAGPGQPTVLLVDENGTPQPFQLSDNKDKTFKVEFVPQTTSPLLAQVSFAGEPVPKSPFLIDVVGGPANPAAVKVYGPAVEEPVFEKVPTYFIVDCKDAGPGEPVVDLKSEDGTPIKPVLVDLKDKTFKVEFVPVGQKPILAQVFFANQPVPKSPFKIDVRPGTVDASKVKLSGPALEGPVKSNLPTYFNIDAKDAGPAKPQVALATEDNKPVKANVLDNKDGTYKVEFVPREVKPIISQVKLANQHVPKSPFKVTVEPGPMVDPSKVKLYGPATEGPVKSSQPTYFVVDAKEAGPGEPEITLATEDGTPVKLHVTDNKDKTYKVDFVPVVVQPITAQVKFADEQVPKSPFKIPVEPGVTDASKVKLTGPAVDGPVKCCEPTHFVVDAKEAGPGKPEVKLVADNGAPVPAKVKDNNDGTYVVEFVPETVVPITAEVKYADKPVPKSPLKISVQPATGRKPDASKVKLYGPATEGPVKCCEPTHFVVDAREAGPGHPEVTLTFESGTPLKPTVTDNKDGTYKVDFVPNVVQPITARVLFADQHVPKSPLKIEVEKTTQCDASKVHVYGPATEGPVKAHQPTYFVIDAKEAGPGQPEVVLTLEDGSLVKPKMTDNHDGTYKAEFVPVVVKPITAQVKFAGSQVPKSPFKIPVEPGVTDASKVKLSGPAVEGPVKRSEPTYFVVDTKEAGPGQPVVALTADNGSPVPVKLTDNNDGTFVATFTPEAVVPITADVKFNNQQVPKSPFKIPVEDGTGKQPDASKVKLHGPAVEGPVKANEPTYFVIDAKEAGPGHPEVALFPENAAPLKPTLTDNKDGTFKAEFVPLAPKPIVCQVKFADKQVPKSPFKVQVEPSKPSDASKVKVFGPAVEGPVKSNKPTYFVVDAKEAGPGHPEIALTVDDGTLVKPKVTDNNDGTYKVEFVPVVVKPITAQVKFAGNQVPKSPFKIPVEPGVNDASKVKLSGPAVEGPVKCSEPTYFVVDAKEAGPDKPEVKLTAANGKPVPVKLRDNHDGTYVAEFVPEAVVPITAEVKYAGQQVPKSPLQIAVEPSTGKKPDASKVKLYGPAVEGPVKSNKPTYFVVDAKDAGPGLPEVTLLPESGSPLKPTITDNKDGTFKAEFVPVHVQPITAHVKFADQVVPKSPFKIPVEPSDESDATKVKLYGPATEGPVKSNQPTYFVVDAKQAGPGYPEVVIAFDDGSLVTPTVTDNKDGTYTVEFVPVSVRPLTVHVKYAGKQVPKSPFKVTVVAGGVNPSKVKLSGPAVEGPVKSQEPTYFIIDAKEAGPDRPEVKLTLPNGSQLPVNLMDNNDGTYVADFVPEAVVPITAEVKYAGQQVPKSPFQIPVEPSTGKKPDVSKVKLYGPAVEGPVKSNKPTYFVVDVKEAGPGGHPVVDLVVEGGAPLKPTVTDNKDGTFKVDFVPLVPQPILGQVKYAGQQVPKSPFKIPVELTPGGDATKVKLSGPALEGPVKSNQPTYFLVDAKDAGPGYPEVALVTDSGTPVKPTITEVANGVYRADFVPTAVQPITGQVKFAGQQVPKSPFRVPVEPGSGPDVSKVKVYGPAVEHPVKSQEPTYFVVDTRESGPGLVDVVLKDNDNNESKPKIHDNNDGTYKVDFVPVKPVEATVFLNNQPVPGSPFKIAVQPLLFETVAQPQYFEATPFASPDEFSTGPHTQPGQAAKPGQGPDVTKVKVYGPAVEAPVSSGLPTHFVVDTRESGPGPVNINFVCEGNVTMKPQITDNKDGTYRTEFTPEGTGKLTANVEFDGKPVPKNPFHITVVGSGGADKAKVYGPAVEAPVTSNVPTHFVVDCKEAGPEKPHVELVTDSGKHLHPLVSDDQAGTYRVEFTPANEPLTAKVLYAGRPVPKTPFRIQPLPGVTATDTPDASSAFQFVPVSQESPAFQPSSTAPHGQPDLSKIRTYGPAVEQPVEASKPTHFYVDTRDAGNVPEPQVSVVKPNGSPVPLQKTDNKDGTYRVDFTPQDVGVLLSNVAVAGRPVPGSPFKTNVQPKSGKTPVKVTGVPKALTVGKPEPINIQLAGPKQGPATVELVGPRGNAVSSPVYDKPDGYLGQVTAVEPGPHKIVVKVANEPVEGSPFNVEAVPASLQFTPSNVVDASKVKVYGPGLHGGTNNKPCDFTIDTSAAGPGNLGLTIDGPTEAKIECFEKGNGVFDVRYLPNEPGEYTINVTFDEKPVPHSPFKAQINPEILVDVSRVRTYGPGVEPHGVYLDSVTEFTVDTSSVQPKGVGNVKVILTNPSGTLTEAIVKKNDDDTYTCLYTPFEEGPTKIDVTYDGLKVPGSPFMTNVTPGCDPSKVKVYGPGIERGEPNKPQRFIINTRGAGVGGVGLSVVGPTEPQVDCVDNQDGTLSVEYLPETAGEYEIGVTFADQPVPGSPFLVPIGEPVKAFYPDRVKCFGPGLNPQGVKQGQKAVFSVVTNQAGEAPLEVIVNELNTGAKLPVKVNKNPSGSYDVEYEPHNEGPIRIDVLYGKIPVPGSPFNTVSKPFIDLSKVVLTGEGVKPQVPASMPVTFTVDTRSAAPTPLPVDVDLKTPQGKVVKPTLTPVSPGVTQVSYTPEDAGPYQVHVKVANQEIPNSPVRVTAVPTGNPEKVVLPDNLPSSVAPNQIFTFKVQKPNTAGLGNVNCKVTKAGQPGYPATEIPVTVQDNHDGTVSVSYPVPDEGVVVVETKFGGVLVPRGRFTQKVGQPGHPTLTPLIPTKVSTGEVCPQTPQGPGTPFSATAPLRPVEVSSIPVGPDMSQVTATVIKPSGESVPVQVYETDKGTIRINYAPTETGLHTLKVLYAGQPVPGDPFTFYVHAPVPGQVTAYGPGLVSGSVNQPCVFTVVTKNAGKGGLSLAIEGPSKADIKCKDNKDGSATITYVPTSPGDYKIVIKHAGQPIPGAPFVAKITGEDRSVFTRQVTTTEQSTVTRQSHVTVGSTRHLSIQVTESDLSNLSALIRTPSGVEEPCGLKRQPSGQLGISFTPKESGEHLVIVFRNGQPIPGSPFRVFIQAAEVGDASRVKIYGQNLTQGQANEVNSFVINTKEAGVAGLSISVQGPGKVDIKCTENEDGTTTVTYKPTEPGVYHVTIKYGDKPVPGSPFTINVGGVPSGRVKERIVRQQQAATMTSVGTTCELNITMPGINISEIEGCVTSPSGQVERCQIVDLGNNKFRISFSPKESGIHYVSLKHKGLHIPGSPFQFTVGPIVGGGPEKVRAIGPGLVRGEANKPCHFTVITREAGAGSLSLGVEGPSKAVIDFQDRKDGTSDVNYVCSEPGEYLVSVKFNGQHIPDSPFKVYMSSSGGDRLTLQNLQQYGLPVNMQTQFLVEFNGAQGKLDAKVVAPSGQETEATVQEIRPGHFSIVFLPKESGVHYVHLLLNGNHIPGSPYPVQVGVVNADPSRVRAYGEGLHHGQSGKPCKFIVNTTESGPGALSVGISGPSKVELQTREVEEGYEFTYTPLAPGPYLITIKYAGNTHIPGSPFKAVIEGVGTPAAFTEQSRVIVETVTKTTTSSITSSHQGELVCDVSKVTASGEGLRETNVNMDSNFTVDGSQAGYNVLHVGVAGPHIPVDKVFVNHLGDLRYSVRYQVSQPGRYLIYVKWGEQHIPGSPFTVVAK